MVDNVEDMSTPDVSHETPDVSSSENVSIPDGYVPVSRMHESNAITRKKSYDKGFHQGLEQAKVQMTSAQTQPSNNFSQQQQGFDVNAIDGMLEQKAQQIIESMQMETARRQTEDFARAVESDFISKSEKYKEENPEFNGKDVMQKAAQLAPHAFAYSVNLENSPAVWEHLSKENPIQLQMIEQMVTSGNELKQQAAMAEIKKVSDRLKQNRVAKESDSAPAPIDRIEQSTRGVGSGGKDNWDYFQGLHEKRFRRR